MCVYFAGDSKLVLEKIGLGPTYDWEQAQEKINLIKKYQVTAIVRNIVSSLTALLTSQQCTDVVDSIIGIMHSLTAQFSLQQYTNVVNSIVDVGVYWSTFKSFGNPFFEWWSNTPKTSSQHSKKSESANGAKKPQRRKFQSFKLETPQNLVLQASSNECRDNKCQYDASPEQKITYTVTIGPIEDELSANADNSMQIYRAPKQKEIISCFKLTLFNQLRVQDLLQHHQRDANIADGALAIWIAPESHAESSQTDENANEDVHNKPTCVHDRRQYAQAEDTLGMM